VKFERALQEVDAMRAQIQEAMDARDHSSLVPLRDVRRIRRAMKADFVEQAGRKRTFAVPPVAND